MHASARLAKRGKVINEALVESSRGSPVVHTDHTGWRIDGDSAWLWVFAFVGATTLDMLSRAL